MGGNAGATAILFVFSAVITTFLSIGLYGSQFLDGAMCDKLDNKPACCKYNPAYKCGDTFSLENVDGRVYSMVMVAWVISVCITGVFFFGGWCWCSNFRFSEFNCGCVKPLKCHAGFGTIGGYLLWLYPVAGALSFAGCMKIITDYKDGPFGVAFYLCLVASCLLLIASLVLIVFVCCKRREYVSELRTKRYGGAGKQTSGSTECVVCLKSTNLFLLAGDVSEAEDGPGDY